MAQEFDGNFTCIGFSLATGDINGDGIPDLIIGVPGNLSCGGNQSDSIYVYYGRHSSWPSSAYYVNGL